MIILIKLIILIYLNFLINIKFLNLIFNYLIHNLKFNSNLVKLINLSKLFTNVYKSLLSFIYYNPKSIFIFKMFSLFIINSSIFTLFISLSYIKFI